MIKLTAYILGLVMFASLSWSAAGAEEGGYYKPKCKKGYYYDSSYHKCKPKPYYGTGEGFEGVDEGVIAEGVEGAEEGGYYKPKCKKGYYYDSSYHKCKPKSYYGSGEGELAEDEGDEMEGELAEGGYYKPKCRKGYYYDSSYHKCKPKSYYGSGEGELAEGTEEGTHYSGRKSPYCLYYQQYNPYLCQNCKYGYWNDNGYCKKCSTAYCQVCQPPYGEYCTQCLTGYTLKDNYCRKY